MESSTGMNGCKKTPSGDPLLCCGRSRQKLRLTFATLSHRTWLGSAAFKLKMTCTIKDFILLFDARGKGEKECGESFVLLACSHLRGVQRQAHRERRRLL